MTADPLQLLMIGKSGSTLAKMLFWGVIGSTLMVSVVVLWAYLKRVGRTSPTADIDVERIKQEMELEAQRVLHQRKKAGQGSAPDANQAAETFENQELNERVKLTLDGGKDNEAKT